MRANNSKNSLYIISEVFVLYACHHAELGSCATVIGQSCKLFLGVKTLSRTHSKADFHPNTPLLLCPVILNS